MKVCLLGSPAPTLVDSQMAITWDQAIIINSIREQSRNRKNFCLWSLLKCLHDC